MSAQLGKSDFFMRILPYGIVCRWKAAHREVAMERPLFFYPGFGKRLKRIVKFSLPYGLVMSFRERMVRRTVVNSVSMPTAPGGKVGVGCSGVKNGVLSPLPPRSELEPHVIISRGVEEGNGPQPDVTVVTVVFNIVKGGRTKSFRQCLDSVQAQTGVAIEHLIIDGASNDGTLALLDGYEVDRSTRRDSASTVSMRVFSAPDKGIYDAMNRGLVLANGRYVTFLNSDDFYNDPLGLHDSVARLDESKAEFSYAPVVVIGENGKPMKHPNCDPDIRRLYFAMSFCHQSVVQRTDALRAIGGFNARYRSAADYDSILRMIFCGYHAVRETRSYVTFRAGGYSWRNMDQSQHECGNVFSDLYGRYLGYRMTPEEGYEMYIYQHAPIPIEDAMVKYLERSFGVACELESLDIPRDSVSYNDRRRVMGVYDGEGWGAWASKDLRIYNRIPDDLIGRDLALNFYIGACPNGKTAQSVEICCNRHLLAVLEITNLLPSLHRVICPAEFVSDGKVTLELSVPYVLRTETDIRAIGISFQRVDFVVAESSTPVSRQERRAQ